MSYVRSILDASDGKPGKLHRKGSRIICISICARINVNIAARRRACARIYIYIYIIHICNKVLFALFARREFRAPANPREQWRLVISATRPV